MHFENGFVLAARANGIQRKIRNKTGNASTIPLSFLRSIPLDNYVCTNCGYVESYVAEPEMLVHIKDIWSRVEPDQTNPQ